MKKIASTLLLAILLVPFISCDKEETAVDLKLSSTTATLNVGATTTVTIEDGNGGYKVTPPDDEAATATISGTTITIKGVSEGSATFTVSDAAGKTATINVTVVFEDTIAELTLSESSLEMGKGDNAVVTINTGNGNYSVESSNEAVATVSISGSTITVAAIENGTATITVTDGMNKSVEIEVTVSTTIFSQFSWDTNQVEFDKAGGFSISLLSNRIALTNLLTGKIQYVLAWSGGYTVCTKSDATLITAEPGKEVVTINLTSLEVVQADEENNHVAFSDGSKNGYIFFFR